MPANTLCRPANALCTPILRVEMVDGRRRAGKERQARLSVGKGHSPQRSDRRLSGGAALADGAEPGASGRAGKKEG